MKPDRSAVLTVEDVPELPNGMATVYRVAIDRQHAQTRLGTLDETGVLREVDDQQRVFGIEKCEILGVHS